MKRIGLYLFNQDCRVQDNKALLALSTTVDALVCLFCLPTQNHFSKHFAQVPPTQAQLGFLKSTLHDLKGTLAQHGQTLQVEFGDRYTITHDYIQRYGITHVGQAIHSGYNETKVWKKLQATFTKVEFLSDNTSHLFDEIQLPFSLAELPKTFSGFRKLIEKEAFITTLQAQKPTLVHHLPPAPVALYFSLPEIISNGNNPYYCGGESNAQRHLARYFDSSSASSYKLTRNALQGDDFSTRFSPYLSHGAIGPHQILHALRQYEALNGHNESTYWIYFELLWREYFRWYSAQHQTALFRFSGVSQTTPLTSFYAQRFAAWCNANTPSPFINALMNELNVTGWLSNRGRQIVASYLINEMQLDWRYGAAYFEQCLIDYDVASNWGNWQYIAGVGADVKGGRHFNIEKQAKLYDPYDEYTQTWSPPSATSNPNEQSDCNDITGWPCHCKVEC
ncbi:DASH family cryptochrome [Pseudoalteromonas sp. MMG005]|uniref:DASH family cryptochrome n=1 Tax=Pseudoalteromonas sp. MMG005 TaxID=2822682 RepID=UPI001B39F2B2|nr:DASH family cryptochrome [Pseudoalteromonas sp. MMG005]MBQ4847505.1 DASH family cryptochrome [Pseudoalteromonas sp. MMG005]